MKFSIAVIPGDGIGPEIIAQATDALDMIGDKFGHIFNYAELIAGGRAIDEMGTPLPVETLETIKQCDAVLLGAMGGPKWDNLPGDKRPERGLLDMRAGLGVFANLRPAVLLPQLRAACPLKDEVLIAANERHKPSFDILIVRELTGGIYFGKRGRIDSSDTSRGAAFDTEQYSWEEIERLLRVGYSCAALRRKKLCIVDKANVLETSRQWREVAAELAGEYPNIETSYLYVDNAAMQLIRAPGQFDVIATSNMFGDILSDELSAVAGSIGMLPSASLAAGRLTGIPGAANTMGVYEPIHGSAPDIAGKNIANPLATILSAAMMLRFSFGLEKEAVALEGAVNQALDNGLRTVDIAGAEGNTEKIIGTREMGQAVLKALEAASGESAASGAAG
jgi:3-isopropylmalate dehydrogenase